MKGHFQKSVITSFKQVTSLLIAILKLTEHNNAIFIRNYASLLTSHTRQVLQINLNTFWTILVTNIHVTVLHCVLFVIIFACFRVWNICPSGCVLHISLVSLGSPSFISFCCNCGQTEPSSVCAYSHLKHVLKCNSSICITLTQARYYKM